MAYYRKVQVPEIHSKDLLELYFTDKKAIDDMTSTTSRERLFLSFIEIIVEYSTFRYITRYSDDIFIAWARGKKSIIKFVRKSRLSNADKDEIKKELNELAHEIDEEYYLEASYVLWEQTRGGSELIMLDNLKRH